MKFSNGTEFHIGLPKYSRIWSSLLSAGYTFILLSHFIYPTSPSWLSDIGFLFIAAGLVVSLVGAIAERREWQAKRQAETK